MYLSTVRAKGKQYVYLQAYDRHQEYKCNKIRTLYRLGSKEKAILQLYAWREDFNSFPQSLIEEGCTKEDLQNWIEQFEIGRTKRGRKFTAAI